MTQKFCATTTSATRLPDALVPSGSEHTTMASSDKKTSSNYYYATAGLKKDGAPTPQRIDSAGKPARQASESEGLTVDAETWCPIYKWGQRKDKLFLTIFVPCLTDAAAEVDIKPTAVNFRAERVAEFAGGKGQQRTYKLSLKLRGMVDEHRSEYFLRHDHVRIELVKISSEGARGSATAPWRSLQAEGVPKNKNERPDFDHVGNSDDSDEDDALCRPVPSTVKHGSQPKAASKPTWLGTRCKAVGAALRSGVRSLSRWDVPILAAALGYVFACPYTKVEESFGLQATHDLLYHRTDLAAYDHLEFPGVVPRTFLGPAALAAASSPLVAAIAALGLPKLFAQYAVRCTLALASSLALCAVRRATARQIGRDAARAFVMLSAVQFHWLFYAGRTLPNTFASVLVTFATANWIDGKVEPTLRLLTIAAVAFRSELALLLGPLALLFLYQRKASFVQTLDLGFVAAAVAAIASVLVDSVFWRRWLWPEAEVLLFNTVENRSSEYGTSPWHWYFSSALPRALLLSLPLAMLAPRLAPRTRQLVGIPLLYVAAYSLLPHKELRFVLYAVPPLNVAAAASLAKIYHALPEVRSKEKGGAPKSAPWTTADAAAAEHFGSPAAAKAAGAGRWKRRLGLAGRIAIALALQASLAVSALFLTAAANNYPGAEALHVTHRMGELASGGGARSRALSVHIGVDAAMSGVSRFLELGAPWRYSKAEGLDPATGYRPHAYALTAPGAALPGFSTAHVEYGFSGVSIRSPYLLREPKIEVLRRNTEPRARRGRAGGGEIDI